MSLIKVLRCILCLFLFFSAHITSAQREYDEGVSVFHNAFQNVRSFNKSVNITAGICALLHPDPAASCVFLAGSAFSFGAIDFIDYKLSSEFVWPKNEATINREKKLLISIGIYTIASASIMYGLNACKVTFIDFGATFLLLGFANSCCQK